MSITKINLYVAPLMCVAATVLSASMAVADNPITLENDFVQVTLDGQGLRKIHDKRTDRTVDLAGEQFSLAVNGDVIESGSIIPTVKEEMNTTVAYVYQAGDYTVEAIYELRPAWRFVSKQLLLTCSEEEELFVEKIQPFHGKLNNSVAESFRLTGSRYGVSLRLRDVPGGELPTWGCFMLVQNPHTLIETTDSSVTLAYEPKMKWKPADGPFRSDRMCIGTFKLTGNTFRADMAPEWRYVQDPDKFLTEGQQIDWAEIAAVTDCARAFLLEDRKQSVRVHIGWCENDYQIDFATEEGQTEYRRIIDQAAAMGCQYVLYTPSHSTLAPPQESRDAWKWESNLMLNVGQKFRKGEWVAGKDPLPDDIQGILDDAKSKQIKLLAYAYPSLPYMQNPEWTRWLTEQGKQPAHYLTVDTGLRSFQDWYVDQLVAFCESTGCAGFSFDHWWTAYKPDLGDVSSIYQQWYGCRRILANLRRRMPRVIMDGRQQTHHFGTWTWLAGTYPHPMMSDEQPGSFNAIVDLTIAFTGKPFSQAQQIGEYDPDFNDGVVEGTFSIPKRIFDQLRRRKRQWPVPYTEDDRVAPWIDNSRLLLFVQIAEPYHDKEITVRRGDNDVKVMRNVPYGKEEMEIELDGTPLGVREGYNGVYPYVTRTCMGMYADISHLLPDTRYRIQVTLPEGLRPGQFQGLFFEHVENEYTDSIVD